MIDHYSHIICKSKRFIIFNLSIRKQKLTILNFQLDIGLISWYAGIFFGGTLPGLEVNKENYLEIRKTILSLGHKLTRDWVNEETKRKIARTPSEMYELTEKAIKESDAVILEYSHNIGAVGQQLVLSLQRQIPVLLLVKDGNNSEDSPLSDYFISSRYYKHLKKEKYKTINIKRIVSDFLGWVEENKSIVRFNLEIERELDDYLKTKASKNKTSKSEEIRKLILEDMKKLTE